MDQKTYGRYGVLPTTTAEINGGPGGSGAAGTEMRGWIGGSGRVGP